MAIIIPSSSTGPAYLSSTMAPTGALIRSPTFNSLAFSISSGPGIDAYINECRLLDLNSFRANISLRVQLTSPAPPAVGLSPMSLIMKGFFSLAMAMSRLSNKVAVGATNSNSDLTCQKCCANFSAASPTSFLSSPVTITTAWLRASSAHAYPIQIAASMTPLLFVASGNIAYKLFPGSILVLVFSPGNNIGTGIQALYFGFPFPFSTLFKRLSTARFLDSSASSWGAIR